MASSTNHSSLSSLVAGGRRIFLLDGLGALASALLLAGLVAPFEGAFGMPARVAWMLAAVAGVFALYSLCCYFFTGSGWRSFLKVIVAANVLYCGLTVGLVVYFYERLTALGVIYFLLETAVIAGLVMLELKTLRHRPR